MTSTASDPFAAAAAPDRLLRLPGTRNLRDVGGYPAGPGRRTRWRTLFRTDALDLLPERSQAELIRLGLRLAIDLRWDHEVRARPSVFARSRHVRYLSVPLYEDSVPPPGGMPARYRHMLDSRSAQLAVIARSLLDADGLPAVIGCAAGVDRTGVTVALLLSAAGVPPDVVAGDYALSAEHFASDGVHSGLDDWRAGPVAIDCPPAYILQALDHLERRHGGARALLSREGLSERDLDHLVERLTEPAP